MIMGRRTYESITDLLPYENRIVIVLSAKLQQRDLPMDVFVNSSLDDALERLSSDDFNDNIENVWACGGVSLYAQALDSSLCEDLYLMRIEASFDCDVFFPEFDVGGKFVETSVSEEHIENGIPYKYYVYSKCK